MGSGKKKAKPHKKTIRMQIIKLLEVKSLMSLGFVGAIIWGFVNGNVPIELFATCVASVMTYFFTRRPESNGNKSGKDDDQ